MRWHAIAAALWLVSCRDIVGIREWPSSGDGGGSDGDVLPDGDSQDDGGGVDGGMGAITLIADGLTKPDTIAVDSTNIYFATYEANGSVLTCPLSGCNGMPTGIATAQSAVNALVLDATSIYWVIQVHQAGSVRTCPKTGCPNGTPIIAAASQDGPTSLGIYNGSLYWANDQAVKSCSLPSCMSTLTTVVTTPGPMPWIVVDPPGQNLFWTSVGDDTVDSCSVSGCVNATQLATNQNGPGRITIDAANVYWTSNFSGKIMTCPVTGCGGVPATIAAGELGAWDVAVDDTYVYWTDANGGFVKRCEKVGCSKPKVIASKQNEPYAIVVDSTYVYWSTNAMNAAGKGAIYRTPKP